MDFGEQANEQERERLKEKSGTGGKVQFVQWEGGVGGVELPGRRNTSVETPRKPVQVPICIIVPFFNRRGERSRTATDADRFLPLIDDRW